MNLYRQKIYDLTHWSHEARTLASILIKTYSRNPKIAYDALKKLPKDSDRARLLKYIDKPNMSKETIAKIVDTYLFYRVTMQKPEYKKIYMQYNTVLLNHASNNTIKEQKQQTNHPELKRPTATRPEWVEKIKQFFANECR